MVDSLLPLIPRTEWESILFAAPHWLYILPANLLLVSLLLLSARLHPFARVPQLLPTALYRHPLFYLLKSRLHHGQAPRRAWRVWRFLNYALFLCLTHLALAQPYLQGEEVHHPPAYRDTLFLIDTSISMVLRDYVVNDQRIDRISMLKGILGHFIERLEGNRIGLIAFSEQAYTVAPLTADTRVLTSLVARLKPAVLTGRRSDIGKALLYTLQQMESDEDGRPAPVVVLLSDINRSNRDIDPRVVAKHLYEKGVRLHTIGIGAASYAAEESDRRGLIYHPANFALLEEVAKNAGGQFYWADSVDSLKEAIAAIQSNEQHKIDTSSRFVQRPLYTWPLLLALLWLGLQMFVPQAASSRGAAV